MALNLCNPLLFFLILSAIWIIMLLISNVPNKSSMVLQAVLWIILLGLVIYILCNMGQQGWAWFVVFLPIIIMIAVMLVAVLGFSFGIGLQAGLTTDLIETYVKPTKNK
jgi:hypothetical protein